MKYRLLFGTATVQGPADAPDITTGAWLLWMARVAARRVDLHRLGDGQVGVVLLHQVSETARQWMHTLFALHPSTFRVNASEIFAPTASRAAAARIKPISLKPL